MYNPGFLADSSSSYLIYPQISLKFPTKFWQSKIKGADFFGHVPISEEHRGLFAIFYDMNTEVGAC